MANNSKKFKGYQPQHAASKKTVSLAKQTLPTTESTKSMSKNPNKRNKKRIAVNAAVLVLSLLTLLVGSGCIYADVLASQINYEQPTSSEPPVSVASYIKDPGTNISTGNEGDPKMLNGLYHDDAIKNILIMGVDDYQANDVGRSDSMMLISVDTRHKKLKTTSFLRDMYVSIPGYKPNRINVAYSLEGPPLTVRTIESNFGVDIDNYVTVEFSAFSKVIDRLGGVTITLTSGEAKLVNTYSGESSSKALTAGTHLLTGKQALYYSRIRAIGSDFGRTERQRKVFESIINKFKSSDIGTINGIMFDVLKLVKTNMTKDQVLGYAANSLTYMNYPMSQNRIPADNTYESKGVTIGGIPGNDVLVPDLEKNSLIAAKFIYEDDFKFGNVDGSSSSK